MTGDEIRATEFPLRARGYPRLRVRSELARIADLREKGFAPSRYDLGPYRNRLLRGYDREAVDRFFAELARDAPPDLRVMPDLPDGRSSAGARRPRQLTAEAEWRLVAEVPGVRLLAAGGKVASSAGEVLLTRRPTEWDDSLSVSPVSTSTLTLATGQVLRIDNDGFGGMGET